VRLENFEVEYGSDAELELAVQVGDRLPFCLNTRVKIRTAGPVLGG
jgi:hypothetical protein